MPPPAGHCQPHSHPSICHQRSSTYPGKRLILPTIYRLSRPLKELTAFHQGCVTDVHTAEDFPVLQTARGQAVLEPELAHLLPLERMLRDTKVTFLCLALQKHSRDRQGCKQPVRTLSQGAVEGTEPRKQQRAAGRMCSP